jgi:hypothetical protein
MARPSAPQGSVRVSLPHAHEYDTVSGQGRQGPLWHGAGQVWLPHRSLRPHTCDNEM